MKRQQRPQGARGDNVKEKISMEIKSSLIGKWNPFMHVIKLQLTFNGELENNNVFRKRIV